MENKIILVSSNQLGKGEESLGESVLETFFTLLKQRESLPHAIFLMNTGVFTATENSLASVHLGELESKGVQVYACRTCVEHYEVSDKLSVGQIKGMDLFVELASKYEVLTIS